jgi:hypothetical protein
MHSKIFQLESIVADNSTAQDALLEEALELTEGTSGITPRFMSPRMPSISEEVEDETLSDDAR